MACASTGPATAFLVSAQQKRCELGFSTNIKCPNPFWCIELVPGDAEQIHPLFIHMHRYLPRRLGRIDQHRVRTGKLEDDEWPRLTSAVSILNQSKLFIDDTPALSPTEVRARCRRLMREHGQLGVIVIDYLQLMSGSGNPEKRQLEVSEISWYRSLSEVAAGGAMADAAADSANRTAAIFRTGRRPIRSESQPARIISGNSDVDASAHRAVIAAGAYPNSPTI